MPTCPACVTAVALNDWHGGYWLWPPGARPSVGLCRISLTRKSPHPNLPQAHQEERVSLGNSSGGKGASPICSVILVTVLVPSAVTFSRSHHEWRSPSSWYWLPPLSLLLTVHGATELSGFQMLFPLSLPPILLYLCWRRGCEPVPTPSQPACL